MQKNNIMQLALIPTCNHTVTHIDKKENIFSKCQDYVN